VKEFNEGIKAASESIDSGKALDELKKLVEFTKAERRYLRNIDFSSTRVL
jgi:thymidine phosphorylase